MSNIGLTEWEVREIEQETKMKMILVTLSGDPATGKTRFMEALAELLSEHGVTVHDMRSRSEGGSPHTMKITSTQAMNFSKKRGR